MQFARVWAMPNKYTFSIKPIKELIHKELTPGTWIDPFAGNSDLSTLWTHIITNDLNSQCSSQYHLEALEFMAMFGDATIDGVIFDPPYSPRQIKECYQGIGLAEYNTKMNFYSSVKDEIVRVLKPGGKVICCGWNSNGLGINRGFTLERVLLVPHGGAKNDTIVTVEVKHQHTNPI